MTRKSTLEMELGRREEGDIDRPASIILLPGLVGVFQPRHTHMMNGHLRHCMILKGSCILASLRDKDMIDILETYFIFFGRGNLDTIHLDKIEQQYGFIHPMERLHAVGVWTAVAACVK